MVSDNELKRMIIRALGFAPEDVLSIDVTVLLKGKADVVTLNVATAAELMPRAKVGDE